MDAAIRVQGLSKSFGSVRALDDVTFDVPKGSLFGLLGPNGAGKTTLFSIAAGFLGASSGGVEMLGADVRQIGELHGRFSMLPQDAAFQGGIPVVDQLVLFARLNGYERAEAETNAMEALELVGLADVAKRNARTLSHGMMKRAALCQAFLGEPELLILDEPTAGLDPENARGIRDLVKSLRGDRTIVFSSHNLREVQDLCDHGAILNGGRLEACDSMAALTAADHLVRITLGQALPDAAARDLEALPAVGALDVTGEGEFNLQLALGEAGDKDAALKAVLRCLLDQHDLAPRSLNEGASLEARFLELTGGTYDGGSSS